MWKNQPGKPEVKTPEIASAAARVKALYASFGFAATLRVTPPHRYGSRHWYG